LIAARSLHASVVAAEFIICLTPNPGSSIITCEVGQQQCRTAGNLFSTCTHILKFYDIFWSPLCDGFFRAFSGTTDPDISGNRKEDDRSEISRIERIIGRTAAAATTPTTTTTFRTESTSKRPYCTIQRTRPHETTIHSLFYISTMMNNPMFKQESLSPGPPSPIDSSANTPIKRGFIGRPYGNLQDTSLAVLLGAPQSSTSPSDSSTEASSTTAAALLPPPPPTVHSNTSPTARSLEKICCQVIEYVNLRAFDALLTLSKTHFRPDFKSSLDNARCCSTLHEFIESWRSLVCRDAGYRAVVKHIQVDVHEGFGHANAYMTLELTTQAPAASGRVEERGSGGGGAQGTGAGADGSGVVLVSLCVIRWRRREARWIGYQCEVIRGMGGPAIGE
jgi:hypothetical protein